MLWEEETRVEWWEGGWRIEAWLGGYGRGLSTKRPIVVKVSSSWTVVSTSWVVAPFVSWPMLLFAVSLPVRCLVLCIPVLDITSDDDEEDDEIEKAGSDGVEEDKVGSEYEEGA
jgi:hypothetical protein